MKIIESLYSDSLPSPGELLDHLETIFPLISEMELTAQDSEWHAEGNVRIHTEMVIAEAYKLCESPDIALTATQKANLILGAALHDIGKSLATREEEIDSRNRIISPHHAAKGCSYAAPRMSNLGLSTPDICSVLGLVRYHHDLRKLVHRGAGRALYAQLARSIDLRLVYLLELCDNRGRICNDLEDQLEVLELFKIESENFGLWENPDPYAQWKLYLAENIESPSEHNYAIRQGIYDYERGIINSPEEALARSWQHRENYSSVTLISAPGGSGKSTWINRNFGSDVILISLDDIREEITGKRSDQSKNGQVIQLGKERLRQALREKRDVIWDSTALRRDARSMVVGLAHDYHAATRIVALGIPLKTALNQNKQRADQIPTSVIKKQYLTWQWPDLHEAHKVDHLFDFAL